MVSEIRSREVYVFAIVHGSRRYQRLLTVVVLKPSEDSMHTEDYMVQSTGDWPRRGSRPVESTWMDFCRMKIRSGTLWLGDPHLFQLEDGLLVPLLSGNYVVEAKGMNFGGHRRISRLRAIKAPRKRTDAPLRRGAKIGTVVSDEATIALLDLKAMEKNFGPKEGPKLRRMIVRALDSVCNHLDVGLDNGMEFDLAYTTPGLGDGSFPAFSVTREGEPAGVEIVFMGKEVPEWEHHLKARRLP